MNVRLQGVFLYGGGPQNHYVFRGEAQRRRRTRNITILLTIILAVLLAWCVHLFYAGVTQPSLADANTVAIQQVDTQADQATEPAQMETA